jgi:hypothetical protein
MIGSRVFSHQDNSVTAAVLSRGEVTRPLILAWEMTSFKLKLFNVCMHSVAAVVMMTATKMAANVKQAYNY